MYRVLSRWIGSRGRRLDDIHVVEEKPMSRLVVVFVLMAVASATLDLPVLAQKPSTAAQTGARFNACTLLPRDEVKKIVPWTVQGDLEKETEMPLGGGSACVYPSVQIYVDKYSASRIESARKDGPLHSVPGIGDDAFIQQKGKYWAELYVKVGDRLLLIEKDIPADGTFESVKPSMVALAKALVVKLR